MRFENFRTSLLFQHICSTSELKQKKIKKTLPKIKAVRGIGLMIGIEMENIAAPLRKQLLFEQHVFTGASGTNVIRLLPPLCLSKTEADIFISRFKQILK